MPFLNQTHYTPRPLALGEGSRARWAVSPSEVAVIFVHGFAGGATDTWDDFADLLPARPECRGHDLLFYGYSSLTTQAPISAALFRDFLDAVANDPVRKVLPPSVSETRALDRTFRYKKIVIVGHSLGAVVVREALIQAAGDASMKGWLALIRLAFFAPAHSGAKITELIDDVIGAVKLPGLALGSAAFKAYAQVLGDLKEDSPTLKRLAAKTTALLDSGFTTLRAEVIVQGDGDRVIYSTVFCSDPGPRVERGKGHSDVCKPSVRYQSPIDYLLPLLRLP